MSGRLYWLLATLLVAAVTHLAFVLFAPKLIMADKLEAMRETAGLGSLKVLDRSATLRLIGDAGERMVHAICLYDVDEAPLLVTAVIPRSYWSISLYSAAGDNFYSFNDRQADVERLTIRIKAAPSVAPGEETSEITAPEGDTLEIVPQTARGVVVFRALASELAERPGIEALLAGSTCSPEKAQSRSGLSERLNSRAPLGRSIPLERHAARNGRRERTRSRRRGRVAPSGRARGGMRGIRVRSPLASPSVISVPWGNYMASWLTNPD